MQDNEIKAMLIQFMGKGFLENIIALFKQDGTLYPFIAAMLGNENIMVRLGATALVEELVGEHREELKAALPGIIELLKHDNPTIRGDAASVLGIIQDRSARNALQDALQDSHAVVREAVRDALKQMDGGT